MSKKAYFAQLVLLALCQFFFVVAMGLVPDTRPDMLAFYLGSASACARAFVAMIANPPKAG